MLICAAIKVEREKGEPIIICGLRHSDCLETLYQLNTELSKWARRNNKITYGFITNENYFLDRHAAFEHAISCGQLSSTTYDIKIKNHEFTLYSEDLY